MKIQDKFNLKTQELTISVFEIDDLFVEYVGNNKMDGMTLEFVESRLPIYDNKDLLYGTIKHVGFKYKNSIDIVVEYKDIATIGQINKDISYFVKVIPNIFDFLFWNIADDYCEYFSGLYRINGYDLVRIDNNVLRKDFCTYAREKNIEYIPSLVDRKIIHTVSLDWSKNVIQVYDVSSDDVTKARSIFLSHHLEKDYQDMIDKSILTTYFNEVYVASNEDIKFRNYVVAIMSLAFMIHLWKEKKITFEQNYD